VGFCFLENKLRVLSKGIKPASGNKLFILNPYVLDRKWYQE